MIYDLYGRMCAGLERYDESLALLRQAHELDPLTERASPYHLAYVYTGLGELDHAMDCLEQAVDRRSGPVYGLKGSFLFAPLREHPRFVALLERMRAR